MSKKGDLSDTECGMVVGARQFTNCWYTVIYMHNHQKKRKYPVSGSSVDENELLRPEVKGEWPEFELIERQQ